MRFWTGCPTWESTSSWQQLRIGTRETVGKRENPEEGGCEDFPRNFAARLFQQVFWHFNISAQILYCLFLLVFFTNVWVFVDSYVSHVKFISVQLYPTFCLLLQEWVTLRALVFLCWHTEFNLWNKGSWFNLKITSLASSKHNQIQVLL